MAPPALPGYLCEVCLDAPAEAFAPAPWGGDMGVCAACGDLPAAPEQATRARLSAALAAHEAAGTDCTATLQALLDLAARA